MPSSAAVGIFDHAGWAVAVTVARDGTLVDRRRVELVEQGVPVMPHHHDALKLPIGEGVALVARVRASAEVCARDALDALATSLPSSTTIDRVALRVCPKLPAIVAERLTNTFAQNNADWVMYREALAAAATARGWRVHWFAAKTALDDGARALDVTSKKFDALLKSAGVAIGSPWTKEHKIAMAAAISSFTA